MTSEQQRQQQRKLRVLVITMGGDRQRHIRELFADPAMAERFEPPTFSEGVSSRHIRNRYNFCKVAHAAGLVPDAEWEAIRKAVEEKRYEGQATERFFDCLEGVEVAGGRKGSREDVKLHYVVELWRKAKAINRARSVLACVFAHLIAMKRFAGDGDGESFDLILEDNVRADPKTCADSVWESVIATEEWEEEGASTTTESGCHFRFAGWLGSVTNLEWIVETHIPKRKYQRKNTTKGGNNNTAATTAPLPLLQHLNEDLPELESNTDPKRVDPMARNEDNEDNDNESASGENGPTGRKHAKPGGNLLWGAYAYWISREGYRSLLDTLRNDVGAILWKGKRMRNYAVKPIDKILPRQTVASFGPDAVRISSEPAFFRAPMLTSKIHARWDPGFCESTEYQLAKRGMDWSDLWLTEKEREVVGHREESGKWRTPGELELLRNNEHV